jgi:hypothetical protein
VGYTTTGEQTYATLVKLASRITLKKVKTFKGMDGIGINADVYFDGKKVAEALDEGCGGELYIQWLDPKMESVVAAYITSLNIPAEVVHCEGTSDFEMPYDLEHIINTFVDGMETQKRLKAICRTKTLIRLTNGEFVTFPLAFSPAVKTALAAQIPNFPKKFGAAFEAIVNEELA